MSTSDKRPHAAPRPKRESVEQPLPRGNDTAPPAMPPSDGRGASRDDESVETNGSRSHRPGGRGDTSP